MRSLFILSGVALAQIPSSEIEVEFGRFVDKFGVSYSSLGETEMRRQIFADNYKLIQESNAQDLPYKLAINEFAHLTSAEFQDIMFSKGLLKKEQSFKAGHFETHKYSGGALPDAIDWTTKGAVTPVKNQGQCGSCWAFSATGSLEGRYEIETGKLVSFSEQELVSCSNDGEKGKYGNLGCNGGLMDSAFHFIKDKGLCTEADFPYTATDGTCTKCQAKIQPGDVSGYKDVAQKDKQAMMEAVTSGPVSVAVAAGGIVAMLRWQFYHSGVMSGYCGTSLDHGVLIVGYGTEDGKQYWKVKNSWGAGWGMDGYVLLDRKEEGAGMCGILLNGSYPILRSGPKQENTFLGHQL